MSSIYRSLPIQPAVHGLWEAHIASTPATVDEKVTVILNPDDRDDGFTKDAPWGPCCWMPRVEPVDIDVAEGTEGAHVVTVAKVVLPKRGDRCLVGYDENQEPWVLCWWPFDA